MKRIKHKKKDTKPGSKDPYQDNFNKNNKRLLVASLILVLSLISYSVTCIYSQQLDSKKTQLENEVVNLMKSNNELKKDIAALNDIYEKAKYEEAKTKYCSLSSVVCVGEVDP